MKRDKYQGKVYANILSLPILRPTKVIVVVEKETLK